MRLPLRFFGTGSVGFRGRATGCAKRPKEPARRSQRSQYRGFGWALVLALAALPAPGRALAAPPSVEDFFVVSSLDAAHGRMVLKRPTEVTLVMHVDERTAYRDERGQPLSLRGLRTGDTVYITYREVPGAEPTALLVRQGPMTVPELERRYLHLHPGSPARPGGGRSDGRSGMR